MVLNYKGDNMGILNATGLKATNVNNLDYALRQSSIRNLFYTQNNAEIRKLLKADLNSYMDGADIERMKLITIDYFIPAFIKKISNVYDTPPLFRLEDGSIYQDEQFSALMEEVGLINGLANTFEVMRFNNTSIANVKYNETLDRVFIDSTLQEWNCCIKPYHDYPTEWEMLGYRIASNKKGKDKWLVWDRTFNLMFVAWTNEAKPLEFDNSAPYRVKAEVEPFGENVDLLAPDYANGLPFTTYRYNPIGTEFWGNGMDALVEMVRSINILLTIANDDTIQESIRLLILNFSPTGSEGDKGQMKTGLRHPLFVEEGFTDVDPRGQIVSADLYNDDIIKLIDRLVDSISSVHHVDNILRADIETALSGIALRIKNEPILRQWGHDISIVRNLDIELMKNVVSVNNYHRDDRQIDLGIFDNMEIDYQEPQMVTDIKEEYDLEKAKWEDGTSSPVLYVMRKNPEMTEDDAKEYILKNLDDMSLFLDKQTELIVTTDEDRNAE